ncbi:MAG: CinA family nicotinamide mononucleotide deamidase-related protein [Pseudomonadales bacterium]|nr:CinA family nicotinamide mononucleotide deamidase-related protein [Pseudomonadales bacterium]
MSELTKTDKKASHISIAVLMTGSELMSGDIIDSNSAMLAHQLAEIGLTISEKCTIADDTNLLKAAITRLSQNYDCLIINGGLGPTEDDLTSEVLAHVCHQDLSENTEAMQHVKKWCQERGARLNKANMKQAFLPRNAKILTDAPGSAAAFYLSFQSCLIIATPGVPSELQYIMQNQGRALLQKHFPNQHQESWQRYQLLGIGESSLQQLLYDQLTQTEDLLDIGFRAGLPYLEFKIRLKTCSATLKERQQEKHRQILLLINPYIIGRNDDSIAKTVVELLREKKLTITTAESCTGGLIASEITMIPGSSAVFPGSVISYSNNIKQQVLQVDSLCLENNGAVSQVAAEQMLTGILKLTHADYGIAVTGIAGPGGGSPGKPVGTVWLAWGRKNNYQSACLHIKQPRIPFQQMVTAIALDLIRRDILGLPNVIVLNRWRLSE